MFSESISYNLVRRIGAAVGVRNPDEAYEFVTGKSPRDLRETNQAWQEIMKIAPVSMKTDEQTELTGEQQHLLKEVQSFATDLAISFQDVMHELMNAYRRKSNGAFTMEMQRKMIARGYDFPQIEILQGFQARQFLRETHLGRSNENQDSILVINFPPPISRMWYRGGYASGFGRTTTVANGQVEWGYFYRQALPKIHEVINNEQEFGTLFFDRLNSTGQHDPQRYYYAYRVGLKKPHTI
jgi:hypothetical protein